MKTKVILGLVLCCLLSALVGSVITGTVNAQAKLNPYIPLMSVLFDEDPLKQHAVQIKSYFGLSPNGSAVLHFDTVPTTQKFIVTDICTQSEAYVTLSSVTGSMNKGFLNTKVDNCNSIHLQSGIVFEPGEDILVGAGTGGIGTWVTISGYYVDL